MTIPNLIVKYQKEQTITRLKKIYSTLNSAVKTSVIDNGSTNTWDFENITIEEFTKKYLLPYFKVAIDCGTEPNSKKMCFPIVGYKNPFGYTDVNQYLSGGYAYRFRLHSGESIIVRSLLTNLKDYHDVSGNVAKIYIDINGPQEPNVYGKDTFGFLLYGDGSDKITFDPMATFACVKNSALAGNPSVFYSCGDKIMKDGWKIANDYPW